MKKISEIKAQLESGRDYVINSDYDVLWTGKYADSLQPYNDYIEAVNIPGQGLATSESRTANSLMAKMVSDMTFEDLEITWRVTTEFEVYYALVKWMKAAKTVDTDTKIVATYYWDDYCKSNRCDIITNTPTRGTVCVIDGLYPTNIQSIPFSTEGGEYIKLTATFAVNYIYQETA